LAVGSKGGIMLSGIFISKPLFSKWIQYLKSFSILKSRPELEDDISEREQSLLQDNEHGTYIQNQIAEAIKLKCKIELNYKGTGPRIVCPHAMYVSSRGKIRVDSFQVSGYSSHYKRLPYWRPFDISKIAGIKVLNENFIPAPGYDPLSNKYSKALTKI
jgi:hypothetical protein